MKFNIADRMIYLVLTGSHAYGFAKPESDVDTVGIAIPTPEYFHGFLHNFEQYGSTPKKKNSVQTPGQFPRHKVVEGRNIVDIMASKIGRVIPRNEKIDATIFNLIKFMRLASNCNPNIIEVLYSAPEHRIVETSFSDELIENRSLFLSAKAKHTFVGFANSQIKRIKSHRAWLISPPTHKPTRTEFGLPDRTVMAHDELMGVESIITRKVTEWLEIPFADQMDEETLFEVREHFIQMLKELSIGLADFVGDEQVLKNMVTSTDVLDDFSLKNAAGSYLGLSKNFLSILDSERRYRASLKQWNQYNKWKKDRNEKRAKMEADFGYDGKHGSHLLRLLRMGEEILLTGKVNVKRDDAEELYSIREGSLTFDELMAEADAIKEKLDLIYKEKRYIIPKEPDRNKIDKLCIDLIEKSLHNNPLH